MRVFARCIVLAVAGIVVAAGSAHGAYDRAAALAYAQEYWSRSCSDGWYFAESTGPVWLGAGKPLPTGEEGFDCAHFVSCCIGREPNNPAGGLDVPSRTPAYGEPGAQRLTDWLLDQGATTRRRISDLIPGDVVAYDADQNGWIEHVALYMGDGLVTAHSLSRYSEWNPDPGSDFIFLHLPGMDSTPRIHGTLSVASWLTFVIAFTRLAATVFFHLH